MTNILKALISFQKEMKTLPKTGDNPHFKSAYLTLPELVEQSLPVLTKNGLCVSQTHGIFDGHPLLKTTLWHESGESITSEIPLYCDKQNMQGLGAATTYARRQALAAIIGVVADDDDDGNSVSLDRNGNSVDYRRPVPAPQQKSPLMQSVEKAQAARAAAPAARTPTQTVQAVAPLPNVAGVDDVYPANPDGTCPVLDLPDWRSIPIHFGKNTGIPFSKIGERSQSWYWEKWMPKPRKDGTFFGRDVMLYSAVKACAIAHGWEQAKQEKDATLSDVNAAAEQVDENGNPF